MEQASSQSKSRNGSWIQTHSGMKFWPLDPRPEEIVLEDIAHSLAYQTRFTGHLKCFYSIAEHSILVSLLCDPKNSMKGLLHDAGEAYLKDIPRPLKALPQFDLYNQLEDRMHGVILQRFNLDGPMMTDDIVKADALMLSAEALWLFKNPPIDDWHLKVYQNEDTLYVIRSLLRCWSPEEAKEKFIQRFNELSKLMQLLPIE